MLYAKDNTKEQHVVFGYKHTLWDSDAIPCPHGIADAVGD